MNAMAYHAIYDFKAGLRDRTQMLMNYLFPLGFFFVVGALMTKINPLFKDIMIGGMVLFAVMSTSLLSLPGMIVSDRESGVSRSFRVHGVPARSMVCVPVLGNLVHVSAVSVVIALLSVVLFGAPAPASIGGFVVACLLAAATMLSLGVLLGVIASSSRSAVLLAQAVYLPSVMLGGLMVPQSMLPGALGFVSKLLPASHAMSLFSSLAMQDPGAASPVGALVVLCASLLINVLLSLHLFHWDVQVERKGRLWWALLAFVPYALSLAVFP